MNNLEFARIQREREDRQAAAINLRSDERLTHAQVLRHFWNTQKWDEDTMYKILDAAKEGADALEQRNHFIQHCDIKPGDTIVLSFAYPIPAYGFEEIHKEIEASVPGCTVLILANGGRVDAILRHADGPPVQSKQHEQGEQESVH